MLTVFNRSWEFLHFYPPLFLFFHLEIKIILGYIMGMKNEHNDNGCCLKSSRLSPHRQGNFPGNAACDGIADRQKTKGPWQSTGLEKINQRER
jgi:hypothetical protein